MNKEKAEKRMNKLKNIGLVKLEANLYIDEDGDFYLKREDLIGIDVLEMNSCGCRSDCRLYLNVA